MGSRTVVTVSFEPPLTPAPGAHRLRARSLLAVAGLLLCGSVASLLLLFGRGGADEAKISAGFQQMFDACEDTACAVEVVRAAVGELGPLGALDAYTATDPESFGGVDCHEAMHELGRLAWREMGRDAWFPYPSTCNFGYYHGVMFEAANYFTFEEFAPLVMDLCGASKLSVDVLPDRECSHGFGHAIVDLTWGVTEASTACEEFATEDMRRRCNEGVAKETLNRLRTGDPAVLMDCAGWPTLRVGVCEYIGAAYTVLYASSTDLPSFAPMCRSLGDADECLAGIGRGLVMRAVVSGATDPGAWAAVACDGEAACAEGFGRLVFFVRNDVSWSFTQCEPLGDLAEVCRSGVENTEESI